MKVLVVRIADDARILGIYTNNSMEEVKEKIKEHFSLGHYDETTWKQDDSRFCFSERMNLDITEIETDLPIGEIEDFNAF